VVTAVFFILALSQSITGFLNWVSMAASAFALAIARRKRFGPLPGFLRGVSGVLLPIFIILSILGLLIWAPLWAALAPLGVVENEVRRPAITVAIAVALIGCGGLMLRTVFRWIRNLRNRYEHAGVAVGVGPLYFYFRRRRAS
jgi:hypothetical protein